MKELKKLALAYEDAKENDYCTKAFPEYRGLRADEVANLIIRKIKQEPKSCESCASYKSLAVCCDCSRKYDDLYNNIKQEVK